MEIRKTTLALTIIIPLIVGLIGGFFVGTSRPTPSVTTAPTLQGEIPVGVIISATVDSGQVTPMTAIMTQEINDFLNQTGAQFRIKFLLADAAGDPATALEKVESLASQGVKVVLGLSWSSEVKAVWEYAQTNHILIISDGSTSPQLSIAGRQYLYRFVPDDTKQGSALARILVDRGIMAIVALQTGDSWGDGLFGALEQRYEALGGKVQDHIRYDPATTEFSSEVAEAASAIKAAESTYGKDKVAVELIAMADQAPAILLAAKSYPELLDIPWFGSDGYCMTTPIVQETGDLAVETKQISTWFSFARTSRYDQLASKFENMTGYAVQGFVVALYDSAWVLTYSLLMTQKYDGEAIWKVLPTVADSYFGATGWTVLNENGDRAAGDYDIYTINVVNGKTQWSIIGHYSGISDSVTWLAST